MFFAFSFPTLINIIYGSKPSWHSDFVTTLSQRCGTVEKESCGDVGLRPCDNVSVRRCQDVATTSLQRCHNIKHWGFSAILLRTILISFPPSKRERVTRVIEY